MPNPSASNPSSEWLDAALRLTGHFEDSAAPWSAVTGNFDGMGVSMGVLQWNFGTGSLQPLALACGKSAMTTTMPTIGTSFWQACNAGAGGWRVIVDGWHSGKTLKPAALKELRAFAGCAAFIAQQKKGATGTAANAYKAARDWAKADPAFGKVNKALFCWFFDLCTQNGSLKQLSYADLAAFKASHDKPVTMICEWLEGQSSEVVGAKDAKKNAELWRAARTPQQLNLFLLSYLRALKSNPQWQIDVMNRKGTVARWSGWVHGELHKLDAYLK